MEFEKLIADRYSARSFGYRQVEPEKLERILEAARTAPTAKNSQEYHIYVLQSEEAKARMDTLTHCRYRAPLALMVTWDKNNTFTYPGGKRDSGVEDATIVATYLMLAAANEGVDSCWVNNFEPDKAKKLFDLPWNEEVLMFLDLGYDNGSPMASHYSRKSVKETTTVL